MLFAHDTESNLGAAVWLVNTDARGSDGLTTLDDLDAFFRQWRYSRWSHRRSGDLSAIRGLRPELRALFLSDRADAVVTVNRWLDETAAVPRLVRHDDLDWHLHAGDEDASLADRIRTETALAMADVIRADEMARLSICADDGCRGIVLDLSRNRSRRYCSSTCSNRNAVAAYRAREKSARDTPASGL